MANEECQADAYYHLAWPAAYVSKRLIKGTVDDYLLEISTRPVFLFLIKKNKLTP